MAQTKLVISGPVDTREVMLEPKGLTLGRGTNCDVMLDHASVSRQHARISQDPFGRWIVEDLGSHNGISIDGQRVKAQAVLPDQKISIHPFTLHLSQDSDVRTGPTAAIRTTLPVVDKGLEEDIVSYEPSRAATLSPDLMRNLNEFTNHLLELSSPSELYAHACASLAGMLDTGSGRSPASTEILACNLGGVKADGPMRLESYLHLSKRVLDAVCTTDVPVMASSGPSSDQDMALTVVDTHKPHVVFAARVNSLGETIDALYVDILQDRSPGEMFDFVEAVARQINFTQKNLFFTELEKQERALREANAQLKEKDRIKDEYVSRVTHDIKGHLATEFMSRAAGRTKQLTAFVKDLLDLTQMRLSGRVKMEAFSLPEVVSKALASVATRAREKSITVTSSVQSSLGQIVGDEFSINEMVTNLLFNAIKYTPDNKTVHLEARDLGDCVEIDVADTGIGIPADEVGHVFDEFFRATNAKASEKDGTGLGLSIVKQIVERHGGKISVQSREGQGTTFTVVLPKNSPTTA